MRLLLLIPFFALLFLTSCQEEEIEITTPDETEALVADSDLTNFISATSKNDGSKDNIVDGASCIELQLPIVVKVRILKEVLYSSLLSPAFSQSCVSKSTPIFNKFKR